MRFAPLSILLALPGCAATEGDWPNLGKRPAEVRGEAVALAAPAAAADSPGLAQPAPARSRSPADAAAQAVSTTRLDEIERDLGAVEARWRRQQGATLAAVDGAHGQNPSSESWAAAQLELSRLEKAGAQLNELGDRLQSVAGDLARMSTGGQPPLALLARTGALLDRVGRLREEHLATVAESRRLLPSGRRTAATPR